MKKIICFQIFLTLIGVSQVFSQNDSIVDQYEAVDTLQMNFGLFSNDEVLNLSLRFDVVEYKREKPKDEYMKALLTYHINDKDSINKEIRLKSRGEFRNNFCSFPPIRLNFKKTDFEKEDLKKIEKMKMVTHCNSGNETYLFKEYLVYKMFNVLTDYSFRVRLVKVAYINTNEKKKMKPIYSYAFFIEPVEFLAERNKTIPVESLKLGQANMDAKYLDRMAIFFYMIGNTDWSIPNQHNCKIFSQPFSDNPNLGVVIPYDFDYTGMVNASYAIPPEGLGIESVRQRLFQGICRTEAEYIDAIKEFSDKKEDFYKVINNFEYLNERTKKEMIKYLDGFYSEFDNENSIVKTFLEQCKKL